MGKTANNVVAMIVAKDNTFYDQINKKFYIDFFEHFNLESDSAFYSTNKKKPKFSNILHFLLF